MLYDLPLHHSNAYLEFLEQNQERVYSVYFTLSADLHADARIQGGGPDFETLAATLRRLPKGIKRYVTLNGRYTPIQKYSADHMARFLDRIRTLVDEELLTGILFLDFYFVRRMFEQAPDLCGRLEAVPSINCFIDSLDKVHSHLMYANDMGFKAPSKIILDRSLNRRMDDLTKIVTGLKKKRPDMKVEVLVNEGCLYQCPFKVNHDTVISMVNDQSVTGQQYLASSQKDNDFNVAELNQKWGCIDYLDTHPNRFFEMPFIRPEDGKHYDGLVDIFKISGKVHPDEFVFRAFRAYQYGRWEGNLLEIMDASGYLRGNYYVFNDEIPDHFHKMLTTCDKDCQSCRFCENLAKKTIQKLKKK